MIRPITRQLRRRRLPEWLVTASLARPGRVLGVWSLLLVLAGFGALGLRIDTSTDSILDRENPAYAFHRHSQALFGGEEMLVVALSSDVPWDPASLEEIRRLSHRFQSLPSVRRVDSLETLPLIRVDPEGSLLLDPPLADGVPTDPAARERLAKAVLADRLAPRGVVSEDGRVLAVNLLLEAGTRDGFLELVDAARAEAGIDRVWISGVPVFRTEINTRTESELFELVPLTIGLIAVLLVIVFRSSYAIFLCLSTGGVGAAVMLGAMGALGGSITLITMILPSIVLALGCAYSMHGLAAAQGQRDLDALRAALARVSLPIALSGLTTAIGFASIGAVRIDAVREAGGFGALGVMVTTFAALSLLPACLAYRRLPALRPFGAAWLEGPVSRALTRLALRRRYPVLVAWVLLIAPLCLGLARLDAATDATSWFPPGTRPRDDYDRIREALAGISPVNVVVESRGGRPVTEPEVVAALDRLAAHLEARDDVGKAISLADPLRQIHGGFQNDPSLPLPESRALIEQYLLLLESVEAIGDVVTDDRRAANVMLRVDDNRSGSLRAVARDAEAWWAENGVPDFAARGTGTMFEFARAEDEITLGQLRGLTIALLVIALVLVVVFRRPGLALIALVPNAAPVLAVFGFMGLTHIALDAGTVMVGSLALGMAVDDTMHVTTTFQEARNRGLPSASALWEALHTNLPAMTYTTVVIALGFGVLALSDFTFIRNLGRLIAGVMAICLVADVVLLPALIANGRGSEAPESA